MKYITNSFRIHLLLALSALMFLSSCVKDLEQFPAPVVVQGTTPTLAELLNDPTLSIFKAAVTRAGQMTILSTASLRHTVFAPTDAAMIASGLPLAVINVIPLTSLVPLVQYHILPQTITTSSIPTAFPNFSYPTIFNPAPPLSSLLRLNTFPSNRNGLWINNVPITASNITAVNGVLHQIALVTAPPSRYLYNRIATDPDLTLFNAAVSRADLAAPSIIGLLNNIGANFTVFAPNNQAFKNVISVLSGGLLPNNIPLDAPYISFINTNLPVANAQGIVFYHILRVRAFSNNLPTTATSYVTLLNGAVPSHPGVSLRSVFTGSFVSGMTCKGLMNATASNVFINPTPDPSGTSDQHFLNGTIHKIDQVMLPQ